MTSPGLIVRTLACFLLVFATWNPTGYSGWSTSMLFTVP